MCNHHQYVNEARQYGCVISYRVNEFQWTYIRLSSVIICIYNCHLYVQFSRERKKERVSALFDTLNRVSTANSPRKASTWPAMPLIAFRNICGRLCRHGCWHGSITLGLAMAYCRNACVCETTAGLHRSTGSPMVRNNRYHACATASSDMVGGTSCVSSSPIEREVIRNHVTSLKLLSKATNFQLTNTHLFLIRGTLARTWSAIVSLWERGIRGSTAPPEPICDAIAGRILAMCATREAKGSCVRRKPAIPEDRMPEQFGLCARLLLLIVLLSRSSIVMFLRTSNNTPSTRSQSCSPASSLVAGGASSASLIPMRNNNKLSHVSLSKVAGPRAICCRVLSTRWHRTACRFIVSIPENIYREIYN